jgi:hypothetical protein
MKSVLAIIAAGLVATSTSAFAESTPVAPAAGTTIGGEVSLDFSEQTSGDWGGTMGVDLDVDSVAGGVALDFSATDGGNLTLDNWTVGTTVGALGVAIGDDNGVMPGAEGEQTLAAPAMTESVQVTAGAATVALGFTDWTADITDISNIQGAYTLGTAVTDVTLSGDMNLDTDNVVLGAEIAGIDMGIASIGGAATYDMDAEIFGFETVAKTGSIVSYLNGDQDDPLQNIGAEYTYNMSAGVDFTAGTNYNFDSEDFTPTVGLSFNF